MGVTAPMDVTGPGRPVAAEPREPHAAEAAPVRVTARCQGCGACLLTCPERALRPDPGGAARGDGPLRVLATACTGCGECVEVCPADAIEEVR